MNATHGQDAWLRGVSRPNAKSAKPARVMRVISIVRSKRGFAWRLVGTLGEEYSRGWARMRATAERAAETAKKQWEARDWRDEHDDAMDKRNG